MTPDNIILSKTNNIEKEMYNISFDIDYMNLYRIKHKLPPEDKIDPIITKGLERACNLLSNNNIILPLYILYVIHEYTHMNYIFL